MNYLFTREIDNWANWSRVYQDITAWRPLIEYIFDKENLPFTAIERLKPGTNAVFKVGGYVVKIFAPAESGMDNALDTHTEIFAMKRSDMLGISVPKCVACGCVEDRYRFWYIIMTYIQGKAFCDHAASLTREEKIAFGRGLREVTDKMNTPCERFNDIDVINDKGRYRRWDKYPETFRKERLDYIRTHNFGEKVFVHGDLCGDNILIDGDGRIFIIDFADAVYAPIVYEQAHVASELFDFDETFLTGYFGWYDIDTLTDLCFNGLLIHDFGGDIIASKADRAREITSLGEMRKLLYSLIKAGKEA